VKQVRRKFLPRNKSKLGPEEIIQQGFIQEVYLNYPVGTDRELLITCSPAGFKMPKLQRIRFSQWAAKMGYRVGTPDVLILEPTGRFHGLFIEFKAGSNDLSDNQRNFISLAKKRRYCCAVAYSTEEGMDALKWYLAGGDWK